MVISKLLNNSPITVEDVTNSHTIFGPDLAGVQLNTDRHKLDRVETNLTQNPGDLYELHKFITLTADVILWKE